MAGYLLFGVLVYPAVREVKVRAVNQSQNRSESAGII